MTNGHLDVLQRAAKLFDRVVVAVAKSDSKHPLFSFEERLDLVRRVTARFGNVEVRQFSGLAVKFVRECGARVMIRPACFAT